MIAYIKGKLEQIDEHAVLVDVNGIGYEIFCANPFAFEQDLGKVVKVVTYHYVREDTQVLYGFKQADEKTLFSKLLNVSGIGPKGALAILSSVTVTDFAVAIEGEDEKFLTSFPGVGKKTARQMILDLKGKLPFEVKIGDPSSTKGEATQDMSKEMAQAIEEATEAMKSLGYSDKELKQIIPILKQESKASADELIRKGLSLMMK